MSSLFDFRRNCQGSWWQRNVVRPITPLWEVVTYPLWKRRNNSVTVSLNGQALFSAHGLTPRQATLFASKVEGSEHWEPDFITADIDWS